MQKLCCHMIKINKDKKKNILILGGSSDIAKDLIPKLIAKDYQITAHYFKFDKY